MIVTAFDPRVAKMMAPGDFFAFKEHPGLRLVATQTKRTWTYRYASPATGQQKQIRLGQWPALGLGLAVDAWEKARADRSRGVDIAAVARSTKAAARQAAVAERGVERRTVGLLVERYLVEVVEPRRKPKGAAEARRMLEHATAPDADKPAGGYTPGEAHELVMTVAARAPRVAQMLRQELRACWEHGIGALGWMAANPFAGRTIGAIPTIRKKQRSLKASEAGALLRWMREPGAYSRTVRDALEVELRTGLRGAEVVGMHSDELTRRGGVLWLDIPGERMKEGEPHSIPLIGEAERIVVERTPTDGGLLFPAKNGGAIQQKVLGVEVYACSGRSTAAAYKHRRVCPVKAWAPHDLRRTARTLLADLGCPFEVGEAILAHRLPGVAGDYNKGQHTAAKVEWLTKLNQHLDALQASAAC